MNHYELKGNWYTVQELSEMSGILPHTLRDRLRRGYSVEQAILSNPIHDTVREFCAASHYWDWIGMTTNELYAVYWKWCAKEMQHPCSQHQFSKQMFQMHPFLHTVPMKGKRYIREKFLDNIM
jgi:hypothetical protein